MNAFLRNVERTRLLEREERMASTSGKALPKVPQQTPAPRPETRTEQVNAYNRRCRALYQAAQVAAQRGDRDAYARHWLELPQSHRRRLATWCQGRGLGWAP